MKNSIYKTKCNAIIANNNTFYKNSLLTNNYFTNDMSNKSLMMNIGLKINNTKFEPEVNENNSNKNLEDEIMKKSQDSVISKVFDIYNFQKMSQILYDKDFRIIKSKNFPEEKKKSIFDYFDKENITKTKEKVDELLIKKENQINSNIEEKNFVKNSNLNFYNCDIIERKAVIRPKEKSKSFYGQFHKFYFNKEKVEKEKEENLVLQKPEKTNLNSPIQISDFRIYDTFDIYITPLQYEICKLMISQNKNYYIKYVLNEEVFKFFFKFYLGVINKNIFKVPKKNVSSIQELNRIKSGNISLIIFVKSIVDAKVVVNYAKSIELKTIFVSNFSKKFESCSEIKQNLYKQSNLHCEDIAEQIFDKLSKADILICYTEQFLAYHDKLRYLFSENLFYLFFDCCPKIINLSFTLNNTLKWYDKNNDRIFFFQNNNFTTSENEEILLKKLISKNVKNLYENNDYTQYPLGMKLFQSFEFSVVR